MKYIYIYFFVSYITYVSATAVNLQVVTDPCACRQSLDEILKQINDQNNGLKQILTNLNSLDKEIDQVIDGIVDDQTDKLCRLEDELSKIVKVENSTTAILVADGVVLHRILDELCEVCENIEELEELADQEACVLENLKNVAIATLDDCNGKTCKKTIGAFKY